MTVANERPLDAGHLSSTTPRLPWPNSGSTDNFDLNPLPWWRTRLPTDFTFRDATTIRTALHSAALPGEIGWEDAVDGNITSAIRIGVNTLKTCSITDFEVDLTMSALLACAIDGEITAGIHLFCAPQTSSLRPSVPHSGRPLAPRRLRRSLRNGNPHLFWIPR